MPKEPEETDVLVQFEIANFPAEYRQYYGTKRHNLFAMIQKAPRDVALLYLARRDPVSRDRRSAGFKRPR
jgi:hypothetical protein